MREAQGAGAEQRWARWTTWKSVALLLAVVVLPFGWILPIVRLAYVRAGARRGTTSYPR